MEPAPPSMLAFAHSRSAVMILKFRLHQEGGRLSPMKEDVVPFVLLMDEHKTRSGSFLQVVILGHSSCLERKQDKTSPTYTSHRTSYL
eukprot:scaffold448_cov135-Ochromonas_danica.AAC.1